jgi:hypothetical protein
MDDDATNEVPVTLETGEYVTPLRVVALEAHEIYIELKQAGFPDTIIAQITAHMLTDAIYYHDGVAEFEEDDDDADDYYNDDDNEDGLENGSDT